MRLLLLVQRPRLNLQLQSQNEKGYNSGILLTLHYGQFESIKAGRNSPDAFLGLVVLLCKYLT